MTTPQNPGNEPDISFEPGKTVDEIFVSAQVISIDGINYQDLYQIGQWTPLGFGLVPMKPFTAAEMRGMIERGTNVAYLPSLYGNAIVVVKGNDHLKEMMRRG